MREEILRALALYQSVSTQDLQWHVEQREHLGRKVPQLEFSKMLRVLEKENLVTRKAKGRGYIWNLGCKT